MMKADDKVVIDFDGEITKEKFTNFELLNKIVAMLQESLDDCIAILNANNICMSEIKTPSSVNIERIYEELEEEHKELEEEHK